MKHIPYARKRRQLKLLVKQLKVLLRQDNAHTRIRNLVIKIRTLSLELSQKLDSFQLKRILGPAAVILGISFANPMAAQSFAEPVANPFGLEDDIAPLLSYSLFAELADMDNDGDYDLLMTSDDRIVFFENTGSVTVPSFGSPQLNPFGLGTTIYYGVPTLVDLDADGDKDLIISNEEGVINFLENTGTAEAAQFGNPVNNPFGLSFAGTDDNYLLPMDFADLDGDGDLDIMASVTDNSNYPTSSLYYFENTGTAESPQFATAQIDPFGLSPNPHFGAPPEFLDIDEDGDLDILMKEFYYDNGDNDYSTSFFFVENIGTASTPSFGTLTTNPFGLEPISNYYKKVMTSADMDNDGDVDLLVTQYVDYVSENPILYIENTTNSTSISAPAFESNITPNPVQDWLKIDSERALESIQVFDITGRSVLLTTNIEPSIYLGDLDSGIYLLELISTDGKRVSRKIEKF